MNVKSDAEVHRDLDTMRAILEPLDDDGRYGVLAVLILWCANHHPDKDTAIVRLLQRVAELDDAIAEGKTIQ